MSYPSTIANAIPRNRYACDGTTKTFNVQDADGSPVVFVDNSEIIVAHYDATDDSITILVEDTDYSLAGGPSSGVITTLATDAFPAGDFLAFRRETSANQGTNFQSFTNYEPTVMRDTIGKGRLLDQDLRSEVRRAVKKNFVFGDNDSVELPYAPDKVIIGSSDGGLAASSVTNTELAALGTAKTEAETAATTATTKAAEASTSATNAASSASAAASSASAASTSETAAGTAQTAAEVARDAAIAASETLAWGYEFDSDTADADPGAGKFRFNNTSFAAATQIFISETADEGDISATMTVWDDSSSAIKATVKIRNPTSPTRWCEFYITGTITDAGSYRKVPITPIAINNNDVIATTFPDETDVLLGVWRNGDAGTGAVDSWNGRTGSVSPAGSDYDASQIDNDSGVAGDFVDDALNTLNSTKIGSLLADITPQLGGPLDANAQQIREAAGAAVASAGALTLGNDGNYFSISGTTAITSIATKGVGTQVTLAFQDVLTLTHHVTDLILPGGADITTAAGDVAVFREYATGDWRCVSYTKADGTAVVASAGGGPSKGTNAIIRTNAKNIIEDITLSDHETTFTADAGADTLSVGTDDGYANEDRVYLTTTGTLPAGLAVDTEYHVRDVAAGTLKLAATNGSAAIDITDAGSGVHTIYQPVNGVTVGPVTVETGHTVTVPAGSNWVVL